MLLKRWPHADRADHDYHIANVPNLEITDLLEIYRAQGDLHLERMGRGFAWLDTGTHASLLDSGNFVRTLTERQGLQVGSPD